MDVSGVRAILLHWLALCREAKENCSSLCLALPVPVTWGGGAEGTLASPFPKTPEAQGTGHARSLTAGSSLSAADVLLHRGPGNGCWEEGMPPPPHSSSVDREQETQAPEDHILVPSQVVDLEQGCDPGPSGRVQ